MALGTLDGISVALAHLGIGRSATERALAVLLPALRPSACLLVGFGGGCDPTLRPGQVIIPDVFLCEPSTAPGGAPIPQRAPIPIEPRLRPAIEKVERQTRFEAGTGPGITVNVIATPSAKSSLWRNRDARVCCMETYWAARACRDAGVPFLAVRAIFDRIWERLPAIPPDRPLRAVLRRPWLARHLPMLAWRYFWVRRSLDRAARIALGELSRLVTASDSPKPA